MAAMVLVAILPTASVVEWPPVPVPQVRSHVPPVIEAEVIVYGGTAGGVAAAVRAARDGRTVALISPTYSIGGMVTNGLGATDVGSRSLLGGMALELLQRAARRYDLAPFGATVAWRLDPSTAAAVIDDMVREAGVTVYRGVRLDRSAAVAMRGDRIEAVRLVGGSMARGTVFIDATYEGDLYAAAGVDFRLGRDSREAFGEPLAGTAEITSSKGDPFAIYARYYGSPDQALPGILDAPAAPAGSADRGLQAYTFRLCVTDDPARRIPITQPDGEGPSVYLLTDRWLEQARARGHAIDLADVVTLVPLPDGKYDLNNGGSISTDLLGGSWGWPDASDVQRAAIFAAHRAWVQGYLYHMATSPLVPAEVRMQLGALGLCDDEFRATAGWPEQLYVREARRLEGLATLTQSDIQDSPTTSDSVGVGTYRIDAHGVQRVLDEDGYLHVDGYLNAPVRPYQIPYRILVPRSGPANLIVAVAVSATHVAWSSLRMEVNFIAMGEAAGAAAAIAIEEGRTMASVPYPVLRSRLLSTGALLEVPVP